MSCISPESRRLVEIYMRADTLKIPAGQMVYGTNPSKWPAKFVDAMETLRYHDLAEQSARIEAETRQ